jgi:hypothetical protein
MAERASTTLPGTVEQIIRSPFPSEPDKAEIAVEGADDLYREIRIENTLIDENGNEVSLKEGAQVDVTIAAEPEHTTEKVDPEQSADNIDADSEPMAGKPSSEISPKIGISKIGISEKS